MVTAVPYKRASSSLSFSTEMGDAFASTPPSEDGHSNAFHSSNSDNNHQRPFPFERTYSSSSATSNSDGLSIASAPALSAPLTDLIETFWESRLDLLDRRWKDWREGVKRSMVEEAKARVKRTKEKALSRAEVRAMEKEVIKMRKKAADRVDKIGKQWRDAKTIRLRDKVSFVIGVLNLVCSSLLITSRPDLVPLAYSIQCIYFLPLRVFSYSRRRWHYFLFDYCYWISALCNVFLWIYPDSRFLFQASYCAAHGPLAWSVVTWRNSMVFHSLEKMTSLFIHIYPPLVFTTIAHYIPRDQAEKMYPAIIGLETMDGWTCFAFTCGVYCVWQILYWTFISTSKKNKIASGERINSYSTMTRGKGAVANLLGKYPPALREPLFMVLQFVYTVVTTLPAPWLLYPHKLTSTIFLMLVLTISVWNGATWYVEVWARKFEKELLALRAEMEVAKQQELAIAEARGGLGMNSIAASTAPSSANPSRRSSAEIVHPFSMEVEPGGSGGGGMEDPGEVLDGVREKVEREGEGENRKDR